MVCNECDVFDEDFKLLSIVGVFNHECHHVSLVTVRDRRAQRVRA